MELIEGQKSGSRFERGTHEISYYTADEKGLKDFCSFKFTVAGKIYLHFSMS